MYRGMVRGQQMLTGAPVKEVLVVWCDPGGQSVLDAGAYDDQLEIVNLPTAKRDLVLLPHGWVVECSFAETALPLLGSNCERLSQALIKLHSGGFAILLAHRSVTFVVQDHNRVWHQAEGIKSLQHRARHFCYWRLSPFPIHCGRGRQITS